MTSHYESYVICTSPRSGSTLLCKLLSATGQSGHPESWFHTPSIASWIDFYLDSLPNSFATTREALDAVFKAVRECGSNDTGIFGLRLQRERFDFFIQQTHVLYPGIPNDLSRFQSAFGKTLFIYLSRQDKLEQAISCVKAIQTGLWHIASDGSELERLSAPQEPVYDADNITSHLKQFTTENRDWEQWFKRENIDPLRVVYEDLSEDPTRELVRIMDRLGLTLPTEYKAEPGVAKLADKTNLYWKERYLSETRNR